MVLDPPRCIGHPYSISGPSFLSTRARNTKWGDAWTSVRDRESRNRGSEVSIIGYALAATRVLRPLAV